MLGREPAARQRRSRLGGDILPGAGTEPETAECRPVSSRSKQLFAALPPWTATGRQGLQGPSHRRQRSTGRRPSKSLTLDQVEAFLVAAKDTSLHTYIVVSLLTGARTEELRPLTWPYVDLDVNPPYIMVWRSVRAGGEIKTKKSRRILALPQRCVDVLRGHREDQEQIREKVGDKWQDNDLVFPSRTGTAADASHIRRSFRKVTEAAGLNPAHWTPHELRHSFVSLPVRMLVFPSSRYHDWSATAGPPLPRLSTESRSAR